MSAKQFLRPLCSVLMAVLTLTTGALPAFAADEARADRISLPYTVSDTNARAYEYLYVAGGYHSVDNGCPAWGTAEPRNVRMIGDTMGWITVTYTDGTSQDIPLVFGYTMWYRATWQEASAPFKQGNIDRSLTQTLKETLSLKGAFEGEDTCVMRIRLNGKAVRSVELKDDPDKDGEPVLKGALLTSGTPSGLSVGGVSFSASDSFLEKHTIDASDPFPDTIRENLAVLTHALYTYEEDYAAAPVFEFPEDYTGSRTVFSGSPFANIATGSVYHNVKSILDRVDEDGMLHTSYKGAPSWRYDGFGYWVVNANSYYESYYSRDGGRALMTLNEYGYAAVSDVSVRYANRQMMYFPKKRLTIGGVQIPGHFTVVVNQPMLYSTVLVPQAGWATKYTQAKFGSEYQNLGNQETDGQGLMMMANYTTWKNLGASSDWVASNWTEISEAPAWIAWCFDHPDLSFAKDGVLYAESEAGMMSYTLYCNVPCMLGLYGYAEMAEAAGHTAEAADWRALADSMKAAITSRFLRAKTGTWSSASFGFFHDPVLTMLSDIYGYDPEGWPEAFSDWIAASRKTYNSDIASVADYDWYGAGGIGYHHSMITQNALLNDRMADASKLVENLCRISYSPRLPDPYIIPEGITFDRATGAIRRQGDLGNLVQAAEAMKCFDIVAGIGGVTGSSLSITPRLPAGWAMTAADRDVQYSDARADVTVSYPADGMQTASVRLTQSGGIETVSFRFGPLPADTQYAAASVNGVNVPCRFSLSGDSAWVYVTFDNRDGETADLVLLYGNTVGELGTFPASAAETEPSGTDTDAVTGEDTAADTVETAAPDGGCRASAAGLSVLAAAALGLLAVGTVKKKHALTAVCLALCLLPVLVGCHTPSDQPDETSSDVPTDTSAPDTAAETADPRVPTIIATAPAWETMPDQPDDPTPTVDPATLTDLVKGNQYATITASTTEGSNPQGPLGPLSCFDGDLNTRWSSDQHDVDGCWLCVDFGYPVQVGGLYVNEVKIWGKVSAWEAQYYSESKQEWVTVYEDYSFTDGTFYGFEEPTEETYRFRLMFFESSSLAVSLWEVNMMGIFAEVPEGTEPRAPQSDVPGDDTPDGLTDLAPGCIYSASSSENAGTAAELKPAFCFDGRDDTRWSTVFHDLYESWIAVDFGRTVTVESFTVNEVTNWGHVTSYSAQVMQDGAWVTVYDGTTFPVERNVKIPLSAPVQGTGFRLLFHDGETLSETVTLSTVNVWGTRN
ncbi:MAG: discoidin domain-containing protein [Clostridia bacterium]|nr:discoidin domain-containing protein [Clostridia bacterium]